MDLQTQRLSRESCKFPRSKYVSPIYTSKNREKITHEKLSFSEVTKIHSTKVPAKPRKGGKTKIKPTALTLR